MNLSHGSLLLLVPSLMALGACATPPDEHRAEGAPICTREYPLGSALPKTVCVTPEAAAETKRLNGLDRVANPNIVKPPPTGSVR